MSNELKRKARKSVEGIVISNKMDKTIVVRLEEQFTHSLYRKVVNRSVKFKAHDEKNEAGIGDRVLIMETRPLSATKRWRMVSIIEKAK
jgi:small subunit ribosomal protein S17